MLSKYENADVGTDKGVQGTLDNITQLATQPGLTTNLGSQHILRISSTARQFGYGSGSHKLVKFLTPEERAAVISGARIFLRAERLSAKGKDGTFWRVAKHCGRVIGPRVPTPTELASLRSQTSLL